MAGIMRGEEIKVFILYLLHQLKIPLSGEILSEIILWDGSVNYFDFSEAFDSLTQSKALTSMEQEGKVLYVVSPEGEQILACMENALSEGLKEKVLRSATRLLAYRNHGRSARSTLMETNDGYELNCLIQDNEKVFLNVTLYPESRPAAKFQGAF